MSADVFPYIHLMLLPSDWENLVMKLLYTTGSMLCQPLMMTEGKFLWHIICGNETHQECQPSPTGQQPLFACWRGLTSEDRIERGLALYVASGKDLGCVARLFLRSALRCLPRKEPGAPGDCHNRRFSRLL